MQYLFKLEDWHSEECKLTPILISELLTSNKCKCKVTFITGLRRPLANVYESRRQSPHYTYLTLWGCDLHIWPFDFKWNGWQDLSCTIYLPSLVICPVVFALECTYNIHTYTNSETLSAILTPIMSIMLYYEWSIKAWQLMLVIKKSQCYVIMLVSLVQRNSQHSVKINNHFRKTFYSCSIPSI